MHVSLKVAKLRGISSRCLEGSRILSTFIISLQIQEIFNEIKHSAGREIAGQKYLALNHHTGGTFSNILNIYHSGIRIHEIPKDSWRSSTSYSQIKLYAWWNFNTFSFLYWSASVNSWCAMSNNLHNTTLKELYLGTSFFGQKLHKYLKTSLSLSLCS